jgi:prenyltransferase beta subunit
MRGYSSALILILFVLTASFSSILTGAQETKLFSNNFKSYPDKVFNEIMIHSKNGESLELYYDDGAADFGFIAWPKAVAAVKFSVSEVYKILKLKYFIWGNMSTIRVLVLDKHLNILFSKDVIPYSGWFEVDISSTNVVVSEDFFVALEWPLGGQPWLGVDSSPPHHNRSYLGSLNSLGDPKSGEDYMIRVVVVRIGATLPSTCPLGTIILLRGGISSQSTVKYLYNANPDQGWNTDLKFNDANWFDGRTPIGSGPWFVRTELSFNDIYVRKIFSIDKIPRNAFLSIASDDGVEVWVNGKKVLSDLKRHMPSYWNYRLNITDQVRIGKNLLAIHVNNIEGACYFDFELIFQENNLNEVIFSFVKSRFNPDGGFSNSHIEDTFYATSILKTLDSINVLNRDKVAFWILSHKYIYGDFGSWVAWQHPAVETLKNLGFELNDESAERLITILIGWRSEDGSWGGNLWNTWQAVEALASLNALNRIKDWSKTVNFIKSLQRNDGGFSNRPGEITYLRFTFYAIRLLQILNMVDSIDKNKAVEFIMLCYKNGGFSDRPEYGEWVESTYWGIKSLEILNLLNKVDSKTVSNRILSWLGDKGSIGYLYGDYCVVMTLKILNNLNKLDKAKTIENVMKFQNPVDGGFKQGSMIYNTEHAIRILYNIEKLDEVNKEKIKQYVLSLPFYYWSTGDIHSAIYSLKLLDALQKVNARKIVDELLKHQLQDGGFGGDESWKESNLWETYLAIDTLSMLNEISAINKEKVINYVLSLKNPDGSFRYSKSEKWYDRATPLAVVTLSLLGETGKVDGKTKSFILKSQREDGGFGDILNTYFSLIALQYLSGLDDIVLSKTVNYVLCLQNLDGGFGWWMGDTWSWLDSTGYGTGVLKIMLDATVGRFAKPTYNYEISITGLIDSSTNLYLDGVWKTSLRNGDSYKFTGLTGSHTISVDQIVDIEKGRSRYYCSEYSITISSGGKHEFKYKTQCYLDISVFPPGGGTISYSSGWYDVETRLTITAKTNLGYQFREWTGDISSSSETIDITIKSPMKIVACFGRQNIISCQLSQNEVTRLNTLTLFGSIDPSPGYQVPIVAIFTSPIGEIKKVTSLTDSNGNYKILFTPDVKGNWQVYAMWEGDNEFLSSKSKEISFIVYPIIYIFKIDSNIRSENVFIEVNEERISTSKLPEKYKAEEYTILKLRVDSESYESEVERYVFEGWEDGGKELYRSFTIDRNIEIMAIFRKQYYVSVYSEYSSFDGGNNWYDEGLYVRLKLRETSLGFLIRDVFDHFEGLSPNDKVISNGEVEIFINNPRNIVAVWRKDYTQLIFLALFVLIGAITSITLANRKKIIKERKEEEIGTKVISTNIEKLKEEISKYENYLSKLEEEKNKGLISEKAYETLKKEYESNIERIKKEIEKLIK